MRIGVLVINFGEPAEPTVESVTAFLEGIFLQNADLERDQSALARARKLAADRAPGLLEDYRKIGGSPLNAQADEQARALGEVLRSRGLDARTYTAFQFTPPSIAEAVERARADGIGMLVGLPVYPMCGQSTTVAALDAVEAAMVDLAWRPPVVGISGWHHHPAYVAMRVEHIDSYVRSEGLDLEDPRTLLYFSAHGTPVKYLREGNRYDRYVDEHCTAIARGLGATRFVVGFQNHTNRRIQWTQPDNEDRIDELPEEQLVMDAVSFMHEQSETLAELDRDVRTYVESVGKRMHRVPVPHADPRFPEILADLVEEALHAHAGEETTLAPCRCRPKPNTWCTNGARDLPPSPFLPAEPTVTVPESPPLG